MCEACPNICKRPQAQRRPMVVIAGCEAHVGVLQTALDLLEDEFEVWVVTDACSSRTERNRDAAFDRLASAGAELLTTEMFAFECLRSAEHPDFSGGAGPDQVAAMYSRRGRPRLVMADLLGEVSWLQVAQP